MKFDCFFGIFKAIMIPFKTPHLFPYQHLPITSFYVVIPYIGPRFVYFIVRVEILEMGKQKKSHH